MRHSVLLSAATIAMISLASCGSGNNDETATDTTMTQDAATMSANEITYYDLETGNALRRDDASGRYVDESGTPSRFYVDVQASDTFDAGGRNVNNAMVRVNNTWSLDEAKVKITDDKMVVQDDDAKLKVKEDKAKMITDDQKVKVTDRNNDGVNEVKVKNR